MPRATFWERLVAKLLDSLIFWTILLVGMAVFSLSQPEVSSTISGILIWFSLCLIYHPFRIFYDSFLTARYGGTLGKLVLGLEVLDENNNRLKIGTSIYRHTAGYLLSGVLLFLGYFWTLKKDKLAWHDSLTNSQVIKKNNNRGFVAALIIVALLTLSIFGAVTSVVSFSGNQRLSSDFQKVQEAFDLWQQEIKLEQQIKDEVNKSTQLKTQTQTNLQYNYDYNYNSGT